MKTYKDEDIFFTNCKNCEGLCATVCEENIIIIQEDFTPKIDFNFRNIGNAKCSI